MNTVLSYPSDAAAHLARLQALSQHPEVALRSFFKPTLPIHIARAPGRLDVMGGIADYSGSMVLELPIAEAAFAAVQVTDAPGVMIASLRRNDAAPSLTKEFNADEWSALQSNDFAFARGYFADDPPSAWAAYVAGPALALLQEMRLKLAGGLRILIDSNVPEGKGVSSSAAIEVATMRALAAALEISLPGETLARLCQKAENLVAGAPCGIMDQTTSALGQVDQLLALRCQPATIEEFLPIPDSIAFWGIDSGVRHSVSGSDYSSVRCGAFMGYRIIAEIAGLRAESSENSLHAVKVADPEWHGSLANISVAEFQARFASALPATMEGREFLERYRGTTDLVTHVDPTRVYDVLAPTRHPIEENQRVDRLRTLLKESIDERSLLEMGDLMYAAHASYTRCGLGSPGTDLLVELVQSLGPATGLYGAKITGGGSGGTVSVLGRAGAAQAIAAVARRYSEITGRETYVFRGSSPGATSTPVQQIVI